MKTLIIGEILTRFSNIKNDSFNDSKTIKMNFGGAEYNTACHLGFWDQDVTFLSKIKSDWFIEKAIDHLNSNKVNTQTIIKDLNEIKNGFYIFEEGLNNKNARIIYDRKNSAFSNLDNLEAIKNQILQHDQLFISGISLAVSKKTCQTIIEAIKFAKEKHKNIIFDFNYRPALWGYKEAKEVYEDILPYLDILFCGPKDIEFILNLHTFNGSNNYEQELKNGYNKLIKKYPNILIIASTKRTIYDLNSQEITGYIYNGQKIYKSKYYLINNIVDRIGTGDAFAAGLIYSINVNKNLDKSIEFATRANVLKHSYYGDNAKLSIDLIESVNNETKDVDR